MDGQMEGWTNGCENSKTLTHTNTVCRGIISLNISCELSSWQTIHMKCQDLFSLKKKYQTASATILRGSLRVNTMNKMDIISCNNRQELM